MLLDALFRSEPLESPGTPITSESAETDNIFARDVFVRALLNKSDFG